MAPDPFPLGDISAWFTPYRPRSVGWSDSGIGDGQFKTDPTGLDRASMEGGEHQRPLFVARRFMG
jgi:hypothetical protein